MRMPPASTPTRGQATLIGPGNTPSSPVPAYKIVSASPSSSRITSPNIGRIQSIFLQDTKHHTPPPPPGYGIVTGVGQRPKLHAALSSSSLKPRRVDLDAEAPLISPISAHSEVSGSSTTLHEAFDDETDQTVPTLASTPSVRGAPPPRATAHDLATLPAVAVEPPSSSLEKKAGIAQAIKESSADASTTRGTAISTRDSAAVVFDSTVHKAHNDGEAEDSADEADESDVVVPQQLPVPDTAPLASLVARDTQERPCISVASIRGVWEERARRARRARHRRYGGRRGPWGGMRRKKSAAAGDPTDGGPDDGASDGEDDDETDGSEDEPDGGGGWIQAFRDRCRAQYGLGAGGSAVERVAAVGAAEDAEGMEDPVDDAAVGSDSDDGHGTVDLDEPEHETMACTAARGDCSMVVSQMRTFTLNGQRVHEIELSCRECKGILLFTAGHQCGLDDEVLASKSSGTTAAPQSRPAGEAPYHETAPNGAEHPHAEAAAAAEADAAQKKQQGLEWFKNDDVELINLVV
ncbi:hypothetical protein CXG81DRAFT_20831 [Caulochytrium protostelioides]|uniref:Uncharacterized protein n=1 Tax=Caulochytrium protostelioides TaxID=1555241 RepID=A0A4P9WZX7_9FUNG|nr:hypothetical protein CXG81DRAFT_20831 [Caulochytrium protostelioides]|eukprot:RKO99031.1 hypothetical protein CXG81DRAFT_20831 [Caulochytrium protostelioides]